MSRITWAKSAGGIASSVCLYIASYWARSGVNGAKRSSGVERVHDGLDPLGHGHLGALEELHRQVGVADHAASDVGRKNRPHALRVAHRTAKGNGRAKGATAQIRLLDAQDIHQPHDVLAHHVPGLDHQGTVGLAAEATIVRDDAMRLGQLVLTGW